MGNSNSVMLQNVSEQNIADFRNNSYRLITYFDGMSTLPLQPNTQYYFQYTIFNNTNHRRVTKIHPTPFTTKN